MPRAASPRNRLQSEGVQSSKSFSKPHVRSCSPRSSSSKQSRKDWQSKLWKHSSPRYSRSHCPQGTPWTPQQSHVKLSTELEHARPEILRAAIPSHPNIQVPTLKDSGLQLSKFASTWGEELGKHSRILPEPRQHLWKNSWAVFLNPSSTLVGNFSAVVFCQYIL